MLSDVLSLGYNDVLLWRNSVNFVRCGVQIGLIPHDTHRIVGYVYLDLEEVKAAVTGSLCIMFDYRGWQTDRGKGTGLYVLAIGSGLYGADRLLHSMFLRLSVSHASACEE